LEGQKNAFLSITPFRYYPMFYSIFYVFST